MGQDLTGIWRGHFGSVGNRLIEQLLADGSRYKFEIQLDQRNKQFQGVTYSYKTTVFYGKATCTGAVNPTTKKVLLEELKIVELRMTGGDDACVMTCFLQYSKSGDEEFMEGTYTSMNTRDSSNCGRGTVFLRKVTTTDFHKEPFLVKREQEKLAKKAPVIAKTEDKPASSSVTKKPSGTTSTSKTGSTASNTTKKPIATPGPTRPANKPVATPPAASTTKKPVTTPPATAQKNPATKEPAPSAVKVVPVDSSKRIERRPAVTPKVLLTRSNELVRTISTNANEIVVNLYDNGTIDNDTVSVYLDKKLVVAKQRLTERPITVKLAMDENNMFHELVMVAENLGEIPPNTSLMVVKAGSKQYEVRITSNEQKNAVVIFKYEKTE